ncbi:hypothetical protein [Neomegalonema sp.]|uniref:hypothetical protein n=1 Tax=Neomegalonema sp. TaxID=2039713 RepID=UPI0026018F74|nr:hypothetical protein [Neomegalonema sp.]MDD2870245.1 hypothetical protein [Neomegalonema sp.]
MALQNRVTPFGEIVSVPARGLLTGNRGLLHGPDRELTRSRWTTQAWLVCRCDWKGIRREVMTGRKWTELFFLDEATALAAGHRPCFLCRRVEAERFRAAFPGALRASEMDAVLHGERLRGREKRLYPLPEDPPQGAMAAAGGVAWLWAGRWLLWSPEGYRRADSPDPSAFDGLLTPPSTFAALSAGYAPMLHPSALTETRYDD